MKCLFLIANNYPHIGACSSLLLNMFFKGNLIKNAEIIDVLACKREIVPKKKETADGVNVFGCVFWSYISVGMCKELLKKHPLKAIEGFVRKAAIKLSDKEIKTCNIGPVYTALKRLNAKKYDVIVAVMGQFEVAAAAMKYKEKHPGIKLVVYQVDPCSTNYVCSESSRNERQIFEKKLYEVSDAIITTPILFEESKRIYSEEILSKMIPMEFPNVVPCVEPENEKNKKIRCVFSGHIYGDIRDPKYTLRLFDRVASDVSFELIGSLNHETEEEIKHHRVIWNGQKSLAETKEEIEKTDVFVNIGNKMLNQVPSKIFEYISHGKPIINICKNRNCPTIPYLEKYKYAINLFEEDDAFEEQVKMLNDFILENHKKRMTSEEITAAYEACTPQYCAKQMIEVFNSLLMRQKNENKTNRA